MPAAARKLDARLPRPTAVARPVPARKSPPQAATRPRAAACKPAFQFAVVVLLSLTCLGLARVALAAKVAEASIDAARLEREVKAESRVADKLELDRSLLVTPSRIESMAADLDMTEETQARYISLPTTGAAGQKAPVGEPAKLVKPAKPATARPSTAKLSGVLGTALELTEREARVLLVGDAALAASR